jgi:hypothetical protein
VTTRPRGRHGRAGGTAEQDPGEVVLPAGGPQITVRGATELMMATGNARGGTPMANEIFEASAGFLVGTGEGAQVLLGGLARKCTVGRSSTPDQRRRAESVDMSGCARRWKTEVSQHRFGDLISY